MCLLAVLCAAPVGRAQESIEWSPERRLAKDDFRGRVPANAANASLSWISIEAGRSVMQLDRQLLEHEQLHFDIAEANARTIRARLAEFRNVCAHRGGTGPIQEMIARADRDLQEAQRRYDRETGHGANVRAQEQWKRRIGALLK